MITDKSLLRETKIKKIKTHVFVRPTAFSRLPESKNKEKQ